MKHYKVNAGYLEYYLKKIAKVAAVADELHKQTLKVQKQVEDLNALDPNLSLVVTEHVHGNMANCLMRLENLASQSYHTYVKAVTELPVGQFTSPKVPIEDLVDKITVAFRNFEEVVFEYCRRSLEACKIVKTCNTLNNFVRELPDMTRSSELKSLLNVRIEDIDFILGHFMKAINCHSTYGKIQNRAFGLKDLLVEYQSRCSDYEHEKKSFSERHGYKQEHDINAINETMVGVLDLLDTVVVEQSEMAKEVDNKYAKLLENMILLKDANTINNKVHEKLNEKIDCVVKEVSRLSNKIEPKTKKTIKVKGAVNE